MVNGRELDPKSEGPPKPPPPPAGLANRGRKLWHSIGSQLAAEALELDERERELLAMACRQADDLAMLETAIKNVGAMVDGSKGQKVVNPAIAEARQARLAISRLLGQLGLPDEELQPRTAASIRAQKAANTRYDQLSLKRERGPRRG